MIFQKGLTALVLYCCSMSLIATTTNEALHLDWLDSSIAPSDNFYAYANGTWQKRHPIPDHYATWGTFSVLHEQVQKLIHQLLIQASHQSVPAPSQVAQQVGDFYFSGMDETTIQAAGVSPLAPEFKKIDAIKTQADLQAIIAELQLKGINACFNFGSMQDFKNSQEMIATAVQGGLGLPSRDYYLKEDLKFKKSRIAYIAYMMKMFELLGESSSQASIKAHQILKLETALATASLSQIALRDPHAVYHMMTLEEADQLTPLFSWGSYMHAMGHPEITRLNIGMPEFFKQWNTLLSTLSLNEWKIYLRWHVIDAYAPYLSEPFVQQHFQMISHLTGTKSMLPRWQRVVGTENEALGFAIGKLYVEHYFPPSSKEAVVDILHHVQAVLRRDLSTLAWMTPATKQAALKKLKSMKDRVGYPTEWWDYSTLVVDRGAYALNVKRANEFLMKRDLNKIGKPINLSEWAMTPQTINAYYDPSMNNINLPAGILQSPFFDPKAPPAVNYGAIGFVIGHEITHGFDDEGAQFDEKGNLRNWWTAEDLKKFQTATQCIMKQFSGYKVSGDLSVQGKLVLGEATADLGGLILAYRAYHDSEAYKTAKTIEGFTPDQQFFLGVAHVWAANVRPEQIQNLVTTDPHPPMIYRVNGTLANIPAFQTAFGIKTPSPMVSVRRCVIW